MPKRRAISALLPVFAGAPAKAVLIVAVGFLVYLPAIVGSGCLLDDPQLLTDNLLVKLSDGLYRFWCTSDPIDYWPATNTTFWLEWRLWGMHLSGYHITNVILHLAGALLVWLLLRKLSIPGAFLAGLIYAQHPVNVESVAWISQRKDVTATLFFLLSIWWWLKFVELGGRARRGRSSLAAAEDHCAAPAAGRLPTAADCYGWHCMSLAAFVLAMLGKGSAVVLPVLLLGIAWWLGLWGSTKIDVRGIAVFGNKSFYVFTRRTVLELAPFFMVAIVLAVPNMWFQRHGTETAIRGADFAERLAGAGSVVWFYLYKALLPIDLLFVYPNWKIQVSDVLWWMPLVATVAVTAALWAYRKSWGRPLLFAWGFFCVALAPVLGFIDVGFMKYALVADHYQHIAMIGAIALVSAGLGTWQTRARGPARWAAAGVSLAAVCALGLLTLRQCALYHDSETLYKATLARNPECWLIRSLLGCRLVQDGRLPEAIDQFEQAVRLKPDFADAHCNLGLALDQSNRSAEAVAHCQEALRLKPFYPEAHQNLGIALVHLGRVAEAIENYRKALEQRPYYPDAENSLGSALVQTGQPGEAMEHLERALEFRPDFAEAHFNIGYALAASGRYQQAIAHYRSALALNPNDPDTYYVMGDALVGAGLAGDAIGYFQQALKLKPDYAAVYNDMGVALTQTGRTKEAVACYNEAVRLQPDYADAYFNLASVYAGMQQSSQAIAAAQKALEFARKKGRAGQAAQIEAWLNAHSGDSPGPSDAAPSQK